MKKDANSQQPDPATLDKTTQTRPDVIKTFDTVAGQLAGVADRSTAWISEQVHDGLQEFVSQILYGGATKTPEPEKDKEQDLDKGIDR